MENAYGIGITNRYALFIDDEDGGSDPLDILKQSENEKVKTKSKVETGKAGPKGGKTQAATGPAKKDGVRRDADNSDKENQRNNQRFDGKRMMDARKSQDGPREDRNNRINQEGGPRRDMDDDARRGRGGPMRGRGRGRGDGRRDGPGRGGKREFDRKSGDTKTGIKPEEKRGGGGKGNWGTMEDDIEAKQEEETGANTSLDENAPKEEDRNEEGEKDEGPKEDEPKQMTLDEWKAMQKKEQPKFNIRKAGEGADLDPKWKKAAAYKKDKESKDEESDEDENYVYPQRANRQKHLLDIDFHFADHQQGGRGGGRGRGRGRGRGSGGGGRGGRDGGEGREGRDGRDGRDGGPRRGGGMNAGGGGGGRGGKGPATQFSLDDQKAFPALG